MLIHFYGHRVNSKKNLQGKKAKIESNSYVNDCHLIRIIVELSMICFTFFCPFQTQIHKRQKETENCLMSEFYLSK